MGKLLVSGRVGNNDFINQAPQEEIQYICHSCHILSLDVAGYKPMHPS